MGKLAFGERSVFESVTVVRYTSSDKDKSQRAPTRLFATLTIAATLFLVAVTTGVAYDSCLQKGVQYCMDCDAPPCLYCPAHLGDTAPPQSELIYEQYSPGNVSSGPGPTTFTLTEPRTITGIVTYHWNGGSGQTRGTIGLQSNSGKTYGPWIADVPTEQFLPCARPFLGSTIVWVAHFNQSLPPGTYTIVDSDQSTWSYVPGDCTGSKGICQVFALIQSEKGSNSLSLGAVEGPSPEPFSSGYYAKGYEPTEPLFSKNLTFKGYITFSNNSGESIDDAIVIYNAKTDWEGVDSEYYYLEERFGKKGVDWDLDLQSLSDVGDRHYDVMDITLSNGRKLTIYFDITDFFGKF